MGTVFSLIDPAKPLVRQFLKGRTKGLHLANLMSARSDELISGFFARQFPSDDQVSLIATGGYGRSEMFPRSDFDILFVVKEGTDVSEERIRRVLYPLWDMSLDVGHSVRTVRESLALALSDMKVFTSLLDSRFITGSKELFDEFRRDFIKRVLLEKGDSFLKEIMALRETRSRKYGESIYMLEPEIKEGRGGLRDYHTALWLAKVRFGCSKLEELSGRGLLKRGTLIKFYSALDLMFDLRQRLHVLTKVRNDRLSFEMQPLIAKAKQYRKGRNITEVEKLMRSFYTSAETIDSFLELMVDKAFEPDLLKRPKRISQVFGKAGGKLFVISGKLFVKKPINMIEAFSISKSLKLKMHEYLKEMILEMKDKDIRWDRESLLVFKNLFSKSRGIHETLGSMHRLGVLEKVIPEFKRLRAKVQHDVYHVYTVDMHSLMTVLELERIENGKVPDLSYLTPMIRRLRPKSRFVLYMAALLHDIGKGGKHHAVRGEKISLKVCKDLLLDEEDARMVSFLVANHLVLSTVAQRGNLDDPVMINNLLGEIRTVENLKLLYLLTFADLRSISGDGGALTPWKSMLLKELFDKAMELFSLSKRGVKVVDAAISEYKARLLKKTSASSRKEFEKFLDSLPEGYFRSMDEASVFRHFELIRMLPGQRFVYRTDIKRDYGISSLTVISTDVPGLFAALTGALSACGMNILSSSVFSTVGGLALDVFLTQGARGEIVPEDDPRWKDFEDIMERSFACKEDFERFVRGKLGRRRSIIDSSLPPVKTQVRFDNESSTDFSIIEVYAEDRLGLLYDIASSLTSEELNIHFAKITTEGHKAKDIFYLTDKNGRKIDKEAEGSVKVKLENLLN